MRAWGKVLRIALLACAAQGLAGCAGPAAMRRMRAEILDTLEPARLAGYGCRIEQADSVRAGEGALANQAGNFRVLVWAEHHTSGAELRRDWQWTWAYSATRREARRECEQFLARAERLIESRRAGQGGATAAAKGKAGTASREKNVSGAAFGGDSSPGGTQQFITSAVLQSREEPR